MSDETRAFVMEAQSTIQDSTLSPEEIADRIVSLCRAAVRESAVTARGRDTDTPGLEEFLWSFWSAVISMAEEDASNHDRLASIISAMRSKGEEDWNLWNEPFDWKKLLVFGISARESMNGPSTFSEEGAAVAEDDPDYVAALSGDPPTHSVASRAGARARAAWLNMNAFLARLWALDVWDCTFYGISTMRMSLEPHSLPTYSADPHPVPASVELEIEVAALWVRIAGKRMFASREILGPKGNPQWPANAGCPGGSGGTWDGVDGYHPDRWQHWKGIFRNISQGRWRKNVIEAAKDAVEAMEQVEREAATANE